MATLMLAIDDTTGSKSPYWVYHRGMRTLHDVIMQLHLPADTRDVDDTVRKARESMLPERQRYFQSELYPVLRRLARTPSSVASAATAWEAIEKYRSAYWPQVETLRHYLRFQANIFVSRIE
jgi:hypothetical protein